MKKDIKKIIPNLVNGIKFFDSKKLLTKINPHNGSIQKYSLNSNKAMVEKAVFAADLAHISWSNLSPIARGSILSTFVSALKNKKKLLANLVASETGKSYKHAFGEVEGAILQGEYFAAEGMRLYGRSLTSSIDGRSSYTVRVSHGVVGLIVPANTPIANIAWKIFPALICGNTIVLKSSEDAPELAFKIAEVAIQSGAPKGVLNVIHGSRQTGINLVENKTVKLISFTGSSSAGIDIASRASKRLARVSLELGGKNPLVVCNDADLENAVKWAILSAFSNAGQRCAAASRLIIFKEIYSRFLELFLEKASKLKLGVSNQSDLGPVINQKQYKNILKYFKNVRRDGGKILLGGDSPKDKKLENGFYINPTLISSLKPKSPLYDLEVFGPVTHIELVDNIDQALERCHQSKYGLTSAIHTKNVDLANYFVHHIRSGLVNVNLGTFGSEPHMPFGGFGLSGNGTREPGVEALDVYSELKNISFTHHKETLLKINK